MMVILGHVPISLLKDLQEQIQSDRVILIKVREVHPFKAVFIHNRHGGRIPWGHWVPILRAETQFRDPLVLRKRTGQGTRHVGRRIIFDGKRRHNPG